MPSSVIATFKYDPDKHILQIRFVTGLLYNYKNAPEEVYKGMKVAISKGTFFNEFVRDRYEFERVEE